MEPSWTGELHKISHHTLKLIIRKVRKKPAVTQRQHQQQLHRETISYELRHKHLNTSHGTPLLKNKHGDVRLKAFTHISSFGTIYSGQIQPQCSCLGIMQLILIAEWRIVCMIPRTPWTPSVKHGDGCIRMQGSFLANSSGLLHVMEGNVNREINWDVLEENLIYSAKNLNPGRRWMLL